MDLILWRHAEAEDGTPDLERALTAKGHKQARRMAEWLTSQLPDNCRILVSPAKRTIQTAEALGRKFKVVADVAQDAEPEAVLRAANWPNAKEAVLVVGHQPTLGQVAALLQSGVPNYWEVKKANAWWFTQSDPQDASTLVLKAVMSPNLVK
jgi:phosphohistidine phosphatase